MAKTDVERLLSEAEANTEAEIFNEATGAAEADETADKSLEDMGDGLEGDNVHEDDEADAAGEQNEGDKTGKANDKVDDGKAVDGKPDPKAAKADKDEVVDPKTGKGMVPSSRLREETAKRVEVEGKFDSLRSDFDKLNSRLDTILTRGIPQQQAADKVTAPALPDPVLDPEGYRAAVLADAETMFVNRTVNSTFAAAHEAHGKDFEAAYSALTGLDKTNPADRALVQRIKAAPDPGKALMTWHKQQSTLREVGSDPAAYVQKKLEEALNDPAFLAKAVEKIKGGSQQQNGTSQTFRVPRSLNSASGGRGGATFDPGDSSDEAIFQSALDD